MGPIGRVMVLVLLAAGCGGVSSRSRDDETSNAGAPSGGATASAGTGIGGAVQEPQPVDLGDGDHADEGQPTLPPGIATGGFFWLAVVLSRPSLRLCIRFGHIAA